MSGRRRLWLWAVAVWVMLVAVAGGATLWLRDSAEPPGPYRWEYASPRPSLPEPVCTDATPDENGRGACVVARLP
ncbi:hypothetical protein [Streptomyces lanatus]|uniref:Secreted protein n=1 Tax=Streptomyces lanatus TaxID=66900 RepID=A0ABV1XKG8_9ACTN|nr:hypothetical protein [Streptomyces lanatus]GHG96771.1 hypothetical protein GCM10018780_21580 [Streptomyces lanatus]